MSDRYTKAADLPEGSIERLVAMFRPRKRVDNRVLSRIRAEFAGLNVRVNAVLIGQPWSPQLVNNLRQMLTLWSAEMFKKGLFPTAFLPVIRGKGSIEISWADPSGYAAAYAQSTQPGAAFAPSVKLGGEVTITAHDPVTGEKESVR